LKIGCNIRRTFFQLLFLLALCTTCLESSAQCQNVVVRHFPKQEDVHILCWSVTQEGAGYFSQIVVFQTSSRGTTKLLWQSQLENAYSPQIRFIPGIMAQGMPLALVERQTGAASSLLDVLGKAAGRVVRLLQIDGFQFDVQNLDGGELPVIVAHRDASILDVPAIYRWNGSRFVDDSRSHPNFYRQLLVRDKEKLSSDASGVVLVNLSRISVLSGDLSGARAILADALSTEREKGSAANPETLQLISDELRALGHGLSTAPK